MTTFCAKTRIQLEVYSKFWLVTVKNLLGDDSRASGEGQRGVKLHKGEHLQRQQQGVQLPVDLPVNLVGQDLIEEVADNVLNKVTFYLQ